VIGHCWSPSCFLLWFLFVQAPPPAGTERRFFLRLGVARAAG